MQNKSREASLAQVTGMERYSQVLITPEQKVMYVEERETEGGLSDQRLLANIIARTSPENLITFWNAYPNIFDEEIETLKTEA